MSKYADAIRGIQEDIKEVKEDVRTLLKFRWKIIGSAATLGVLASVTITLVKLFIWD